MFKTPLNKISDLFGISTDMNDEKFLKWLCRILDGKDESRVNDTQECSTIQQIYDNYCISNSMQKQDK